MTGVASIRWVRPALTTPVNSSAFWRKARARWRRAGTREPAISTVAATWMADGKTSLEDWDAFTSSLGWTRRPRRSEARVARTSFMFILDEVPDPVWKTSTGNSASQCPSATSRAASAMAAATSAGTTPRSAFTRAAALFTSASPRMSARSMPRPETGKFSTARWVCACHLASAGTLTSPMESCSVRYSPASSGPVWTLGPSGLLIC